MGKRVKKQRGTEMDFKQLVAKERSEKAERIKKETSGCQIIYSWGAGFSLFIFMLFGLDMDMSDVKSFIMIILGIAVCYISFNKYLYYCKENGKFNNNIFAKYQYIPVDIRKIFWAKAVIAGQNILGFTLSGQILSLFVVAINPGNEGAAITDLHVWIPLMTGVITLILLLLNMSAACKKPNSINL
ncbi:MAG: hypothetical protein NC314_06825 [Roseburia sp.]|nr:hypothetical protein [Ruminococcus sp.]MCM1155413.1 hypothetical protein [Roseburia sp.]MCM1242540.1 hypothetical protein [Roseburia sp.]